MPSPEAELSPSRARKSPLALAALLVALTSYLCLWGVGGLTALVLGLTARREIRASQGRLAGGRMASAAALLGALNLTLFACGIAVLAQHWLTRPRPVSAPVAIETPASPPPLDTSFLPGPTPGHYSEDSQVQSVEIGRVVLIDLGPEVRSLRDELTRQRKLAAEHHGALLVWVVAPQCGPCNGVSASLSDPLMQRALSNTRLVRVDRSRFAPELADLGIPHDVIPGFALLDQQNRPIDYIHGGEWDEDIAPNIAPVLGEFVRGTYKARREPWRGIKRRDETAL